MCWGWACTPGCDGTRGHLAVPKVTFSDCCPLRYRTELKCCLPSCTVMCGALQESFSKQACRDFLKRLVQGCCGEALSIWLPQELQTPPEHLHPVAAEGRGVNPPSAMPLILTVNTFFWVFDVLKPLANGSCLSCSCEQLPCPWLSRFMVFPRDLLCLVSEELCPFRHTLLRIPCDPSPSQPGSVLLLHCLMGQHPNSSTAEIFEVDSLLKTNLLFFFSPYKN